ncbi:unnamed protein product, partial [Symbiodinium sp. CCMP2456]
STSSRMRASLYSAALERVTELERQLKQAEEDKATKAKNHKGELEAAAARLEAAEAARVKEVENLNIAHQKVIDNMKGDKAKALAVTAAVLERDLEHLKGENKGLVKQ